MEGLRYVTAMKYEMTAKNVTSLIKTSGKRKHTSI
jgi:hypothetical protein